MKPFQYVRIFGIDVTELLETKDMPQQREMTPEQYAALEPDKALRTMQIIAGALIAGVLSFAGVASVIVLGQAPVVKPAGQPEVANHVLKLIAFGVFFLNAILSFIVPKWISRFSVNGVAKMVQDGTLTGPKELLGRLLSVAQTKTIVALALVEGASFFALIVVIVTKSFELMSVVGASFCFMTAHFPTKLRVARWLEEQQRVLS